MLVHTNIIHRCRIGVLLDRQSPAFDACCLVRLVDQDIVASRSLRVACILNSQVLVERCAFSD